MLLEHEGRRTDRNDTDAEEIFRESASVRTITDSPCVSIVLYAEFDPTRTIEEPTAEDLARHAIQSVKTADVGKDGISYLMSNLAAGVKTPLTSAYEVEILRQTQTESLDEALIKVKVRNGMSESLSARGESR